MSGFAGQLSARDIKSIADDKFVARHDRLSNAGETCYDWQHYNVGPAKPREPAWVLAFRGEPRG